MKTKLVSIIVIFFVASIFISYAFVALALQRSYSIPDNEANYSNSTVGGEAIGEEEDYMNIGVFIGPRPGATNVSLDSLIYVDQMRPVYVDLQINPKIPLAQIERDVGHASRLTIFYPEQFLQPDTTYNVSGTMMGLSAWWTFTTGSSIFPNEDYEVYLPFYAWWIAFLASIIATTSFVVIIKRIQSKKSINRL